VAGKEGSNKHMQLSNSVPKKKHFSRILKIYTILIIYTFSESYNVHVPPISKFSMLAIMLYYV
jgi:hypothetical protein